MPSLKLVPTNPLFQLPATIDQKKTLVEEEVALFDGEMQKLGNSPLVSSELAIIRTYLILKLTDRM